MTVKVHTHRKPAGRLELRFVESPKAEFGVELSPDEADMIADLLREAADTVRKESR